MTSSWHHMHHREAGVLAGGLACAVADPYSRVVGNVARCNPIQSNPMQSNAVLRNGMFCNAIYCAVT